MNTQELRIDNDFAALIPPLTDDEYSRLEQSIIADGCREPIVVWNNTIVDGHHRYKVCKKHNIPFSIVQKEFASRDDVILWMIQNQLGKRNLNTFRRIEMVRNYERAVKAQAKARQGTRNDIKQLSGNFSGMSLPNGRDARDELGNMAGVSGNTYQHAIYVLDNAPPTIIEAARNDSISINAAYALTKMTETQQTEALKRIEQGEPAKSVISQIKSSNRKPKPDTTTNTADDVSPQSAASEISYSNEVINVQHEANPTIMNEEKQPQEVPTPPEEQIPLKEPPETPQKADFTNQVASETKEHEIQPQSQVHSEAKYDTTLPSHQEALQTTITTGSSQEITTTTKNENEIAPEVQIVDIYTTEKKYKIIYANPTWEGKQSADELCKLPVERITDKDCALFLWIKSNKMIEAIKVINTWGFTYMDIAFMWVKIQKENKGFHTDASSGWTRSFCELCLLATRGTIQRTNVDVKQYFPSPALDGGKKPKEAKDMTVQLLGALPALELFPDLEALEQQDQFTTQYNGQLVEWDMAASREYLAQLAEERRAEMHNIESGT